MAPPVSSPVRRCPPALSHLQRAAELLEEAGREVDAPVRFALARLSGLTTAWAACAGSVDAAAHAAAAGPWALVATVRPDLAEWAGTFAASDRRWSALCRGDTAAAAGTDQAAADALVRAAAGFRRAVLPPPAVPGSRLP